MDSIIIPVPEAHWRYGTSYRPGEIIWSPWSKNTICKGYADLVGALLASGIVGNNMGAIYNTPLFIAIGQGNTTGDWDGPNGPNAANPDEKLLENELTTGGRKECTVSGFRQGDPPWGAIYAPEQAYGRDLYRPVFSAKWDVGEAVSVGGSSTRADLRTVGLFGGPNSHIMNQGLLLNKLNYPVQYKDLTDPYILYWEVEFKIKWSENG